MTELSQAIPPTAITSSALIVIVIGNPVLLYGFMLTVGIACIIWSVSIIRGCNERQRRLEKITSRAERRKNASIHNPAEPS